MNDITKDFQGGRFLSTYHSPGQENRPFWAQLTAFDNNRFYSWFEVYSEKVNGVPTYIKKEGGRNGSIASGGNNASNPAFEPNSAILSTPIVVVLRRAYFDQINDWVYEIFNTGGGSGGTTVQFARLIGSGDSQDQFGHKLLNAVLETWDPVNLVLKDSTQIWVRDFNVS